MIAQQVCAVPLLQFFSKLPSEYARHALVPTLTEHIPQQNVLVIRISDPATMSDKKVQGGSIKTYHETFHRSVSAFPLGDEKSQCTLGQRQPEVHERLPSVLLARSQLETILFIERDRVWLCVDDNELTSYSIS